MLTDAALRNLKPKSKIYKASDRDGMYVTVSPSGTVTFRYDYRFNGRRETLTLGRYGPGGISLAMARELLLDARKTVLKGISPALEKQREKRRVVAIETFGTAMETWLANARLADSTRAMRKHIIDRDILPVFQNRLLTEIQPEDLRALCNKVKERGAPATAVQIRDIVKQVYVYAIAHGEKVDNTGSLQAPAPPYTVMAGTIIPAALVTGINSDLPGQIIAEVTQPVYDTATGHYLLIPQGSRLIGRYDSQVAFGQQRVLLVWLRLVLPDTSSIALDKLPGIDPAGYAGLEDGVDWHWGRILAGAVLSTMLGVGSELAVSNQGSANGNTVIALRDSSQDTANQVGQEITRRDLSIQPTLTVRPGFQVNVMVNKDLVLRPYQPLFVQRGPMP
ncbi:TrbI/VirB10 family protein [Paraburkholderia saeva]|uniref:Core-binding (CB) domain-containing protein n=1 Tax=Paraburkholderia saeva TaxID=2777537 RepID=A0A9N8X1G5_9BURK|nr:TrbI/VirB10 family protein [Paraburkholderia saeva]CAG4899764.1 hypothetical protein LMG31841_02826 [Paraburkholderia saeva]